MIIHKFIVDNGYFHKKLKRMCFYTSDCAHLQFLNDDDEMIYMDFDGKIKHVHREYIISFEEIKM